LLALFSLNIYRARTQSITTDEAYTYDLYISGSPADIFKVYIANNHVLHTILCRISVGIFGLSEFTMRIPSLLGGLFYMVTVLRLCRYVFGDGWFSLLSFALLSMSPAVLDYMSAARGYGLALAFFFWALLHMVIYRIERRQGSLAKAAVGLALSVASNLTFVFPGAALGMIFTFWLIRERQGRLAVDCFLVPCVVIAFAILVAPLAHASKDSFHFGATDLRASVDSVLLIAWAHHGDRGIDTLLHWAKIPLAVTLAIAALMSWRAKKDASGSLLTLAAGSLIGSVALAIMANRELQVLYPMWRSGLYWIPLFLLTCLLMIHSLLNLRYRLVAVPFLAAATLCLGQFVSQLCVRHYAEWPDDASNRRIAQEIGKHHASTLNNRVKVAAVSWELEEGLNFYRRMYHWTWMQPVQRVPANSSFDYYVALPDAAEKLDQLPVRKIYEDAATHAVVAVKR
jgi:4-amino-4-deoxy-L-arabinose transferase-like glycosyltransferase